MKYELDENNDSWSPTTLPSYENRALFRIYIWGLGPRTDFWQIDLPDRVLPIKFPAYHCAPPQRLTWTRRTCMQALLVMLQPHYVITALGSVNFYIEESMTTWLNQNARGWDIVAVACRQSRLELNMKITEILRDLAGSSDVTGAGRRHAKDLY